jgi:hypothetical protein
MRYARQLLVIAALVLPAAASAQTAPAAARAPAQDTAAVAREVVHLSLSPGFEGRFNRMIGEAVAKLPADRQAAARADLQKAAADAREEILAAIAAQYATAFTPAELNDLLAFFKSPLGLKLVKVEEAKSPEVNAAIQQQIMKLVVQMSALPR